MHTSSAERSAVRCRALPCCERRCTFTTSCMPVKYQVSYRLQVLLLPRQVYRYCLDVSQTMHPQLRSARLYIELSSAAQRRAAQRSAAQRSAAQCGTVPCPSFWGVVSCGVVRSFEHIAVCCTRYDTGTRYHYVRVVYSSSCFLQL